MFAMGALLAAVPTGLASPDAGTLKLDWYNNGGGNPPRETDQLMLLYVAEGTAIIQG
jgi:hypothetical protein